MGVEGSREHLRSTVAGPGGATTRKGPTTRELSLEFAVRSLSVTRFAVDSKTRSPSLTGKIDGEVSRAILRGL